MSATVCPGVQEQAITFACCGESLVGVVSMPAQEPTLGIVIVVGGPQYRGGSHRHFVQLARRAAAAGYAVLRFDCRGMGDSTGHAPGFEHAGPDIDAAIRALRGAAPTVQQVVLWGLCDGASASLLYLDENADAPVAGLCLLNPWARSEATLAQVHVKHYYTQRLREKAFWIKLLRGGVSWSALSGLARNLRRAFGARPAAGKPDVALPYTDRMARAWARFAGPIQLVLSGNDLTAREFEQVWSAAPAWQAARAQAHCQRVVLDGADHTLSAPADATRAEQALLQWLAPLAAGAPRR